jgi:hypothetical protein
MNHPTSGYTVIPAIDGVAVTSNTPFDRSTYLLCSADTVATVTFASGNVVPNVPLQKGYNAIQATMVVFGAGTIIALYN